MSMNNASQGKAYWLTIVLAMLLSTASAQVLSENIQAQATINDNAAGSQRRVNALAEEADELLAEYRQVIRELENLTVYNDQLEIVVNNQQEEMVSIQKQMDQLESTNRAVTPMLLEMIAMLKQMIEQDVPFLMDERRERVLKLEDLMDNPNVTTSERYRRVMEAYQVEMEYGRSFSQYTANLPGTDRTVKFLKLGRTALVFQSLDGMDTGWWNPSSRQFEKLSEEYRLPVQQALRIAANQAAPELVKLPIIAPVKAQ